MRVKFKKILIINPFGLGDVLFTTPVVRALKEAYPGCYIAYLCNQRSAFLLENNSLIDKLFFFSRGDWKRMKKKSIFHFIGYFVYNLIRLGFCRFDIVVDLSLVSQYSVIMKALGIKKRWGFNYRNRGRFLTDSIKFDGFNDKHVISYYNDLLLKMGIKSFSNKLELFVSNNEVVWVDEFLQLNKVAHNAFIVGISPFGGASWGKDSQAKQWPTDNFLEVAKHLINKYNATIILLGLEHEKPALEDFKNKLNNKAVINAAGKTQGGNLTALINSFDLFIGNDSGLLHMASALNINSVSIFGPVDEKVYGPVPDEAIAQVLTSSSSECRPCYQNFQKGECQTMECLKGIAVEEVISTVERIIG